MTRTEQPIKQVACKTCGAPTLARRTLANCHDCRTAMRRRATKRYCERHRDKENARRERWRRENPELAKQYRQTSERNRKAKHLAEILNKAKAS